MSDSRDTDSPSAGQNALENQVTRLWNAQEQFRAALAAGDIDRMEVAAEVIIILAERSPQDSALRKACVHALCRLHDAALVASIERVREACPMRRPPAPLTAELIERPDRGAVIEFGMRLPDSDARYQESGIKGEGHSDA